MNYIDKYLREEIELKKKKINGNSRFFDERNKLIVRDLRTLGDLYSFWIENPSLRRAFLLEKKQPKTVKKISKKGIRNINNAWYFLSHKGKDNEFMEEFDAIILKRLNGLILGKKDIDFRKKDVTLNLRDYTPPSFEKVPEKIEKAFLKIKQLYRKDPLESAILSNLEFSAIQPFLEGNKRTARLIQDRILYESGFPPAIISAGEAKYYLSLFCRTLPFYESEDISGQKEFFNYCASKVNNSMDEILKD